MNTMKNLHSILKYSALISLSMLVLLINRTEAQNAEVTIANFVEYSPHTGASTSHTEVSRDVWDTQFVYPIVDTMGTAGIESDGNYIYTTNWINPSFSKYDIQGNFIENFNIPGVTSIRDLAYDGQYFYGSKANDTLYTMDFENQTLVNKTFVGVNIRSIAYNQDLDVFYANNWSTDISIFDINGNILGQFPADTTIGIYGLAYDNTTPGGPFLWAFTQDPPTSCMLKQYDLNTQTLTSFLMDLSYLGQSTYIAGGLFTHPNIVPGTMTLGGVIQNDVIFGLELGPYALDCHPPQNLSGSANIADAILSWDAPASSTNNLGAFNIYRDGSLIYSDTLLQLSFTDSGLLPGTYSYEVTAVYDNGQGFLLCESDPAGPVSVSILPPPCDPPLNLTASVYGFDVELDWNVPASNHPLLLGYQIYRDGSLINTNVVTDTSYLDVGLSLNSYSYEVTAQYIDGQGNVYCESVAAGPVIADVIPPIFTLGGNVFAGSAKMNLGYVNAYSYENDVVTNAYDTDINDTLGYYYFFPFDTKTYFVQAFPNESSAFSESYIPTYYGDAMHWEDATEVYLNENIYNADIALNELHPITSGPGSIGGRIFDQHNHFASAPSEDVLVFLMTPNNECIALTTSNLNGHFKFNNLAYGSYKLLVEIVGKRMNAVTYTLEASQPDIKDISFIVESGEILIGIEEELPFYVSFMSELFPNPVSLEAQVEINLQKATTVKRRIIDASNRILNNDVLELNSGTNRLTIDVSSLSSGIYYYTLEFEEGHMIHRKLVVVK